MRIETPSSALGEAPNLAAARYKFLGRGAKSLARAPNYINSARREGRKSLPGAIPPQGFVEIADAESVSSTGQTLAVASPAPACRGGMRCEVMRPLVGRMTMVGRSGRVRNWTTVPTELEKIKSPLSVVPSDFYPAHWIVKSNAKSLYARNLAALQRSARKGRCTADCEARASAGSVRHSRQRWRPRRARLSGGVTSPRRLPPKIRSPCTSGARCSPTARTCRATAPPPPFVPARSRNRAMAGQEASDRVH